MYFKDLDVQSITKQIKSRQQQDFAKQQNSYIRFQNIRRMVNQTLKAFHVVTKPVRTLISDEISEKNVFTNFSVHDIINVKSPDLFETYETSLDLDKSEMTNHEKQEYMDKICEMNEDDIQNELVEKLQQAFNKQIKKFM